MIYETYSFKQEPLWDSVKEEKIENFNWETDVIYRPNTYFKMCFVENKGIFLKMRTDETDLRRECHGIGQSVWEDSCMEFFFCPVEGRKEYFNLEFNPNAAFICHVGPTKPGRRDIFDFTKIQPVIETQIDDNGWCADVFVPCEMVSEVLGTDFEAKASHITGNFYKCGDKTKIPHFGSFAKMTTLPPGFHNPECFAKIIIKEKD